MEEPLVPQVLLQHGQFVRSLAHGLLHDAHAAEDVAQEVWARFLQRPPVGNRGLRSWLRTVVRNLAANAGRSASRRASRERYTARPEAVDAELELEQSELLRAVVEAVLELEEPHRQTILARYWRGLDVAEVAAECGASASTVRNREQHALEKLRRRLDRRHRGERAAWAVALATVSGQAVDRPDGPLVREVSATVKLAAVLAIAVISLGGVRWFISSSSDTVDAPTAPTEVTSLPHRKSASQGVPGALRMAREVGSSAREPVSGMGALGSSSSGKAYPIRGVLRHSKGETPVATATLVFECNALSQNDPAWHPPEVQTDVDGRFGVDLPEGIFQAVWYESPETLIYPQIEPLIAIPTQTQELQLNYVDPDAWLDVRVVTNGVPFANAEIETHFANVTARLNADRYGYATIGFPKTGPGEKMTLIAYGRGDDNARLRSPRFVVDYADPSPQGVPTPMVDTAASTALAPRGDDLISLPAFILERPPDIPLVLELKPSARLVVHAQNGDGVPLRDHCLEASNKQLPYWPGWSTSTNALGVGSLALPEGHYTVEFYDPVSERECLKEVDVGWGSKINLDLVFRVVPLAVSGSVVDERGAPLANIHLQVVWPEDPDEGYVSSDASTDQNGLFAFHRSGSGVLHLTTESDLLGDRFEPSAVDLPFGTRDVILRRVASRSSVMVPVEVVAANSLEHPRMVQPALFRPPSSYAYTSAFPGGLGTIEVKDYADLSVKFRSIGFRSRTVPVADLLRGKGIQRVVLEPGFRAVVVVSDQDGDHRPIVGASVMDRDKCLATADANGRIVLDLDYWPETFTFTAPDYESEEWQAERWLAAFDEAPIWLVRTQPGEDRDTDHVTPTSRYHFEPDK